jgi:hypothetical protein
MEFPIEIQRIINEYSKPMTRPDWRKGNYMMQLCTTEARRKHLKYTIRYIATKENNTHYKHFWKWFYNEKFKILLNNDNNEGWNTESESESELESDSISITITMNSDISEEMFIMDIHELYQHAISSG